MYEQSAHAYDLIVAAQGKDYNAEARHVADAIRRRRPDARSLLDVACGTGGHLDYFRQDFETEGVDLSAAMLERARLRLGSTPLHRGDIRTFQLPRRFDAVTCLFSSVGYLVPVTELARGIENLASHLVEGGVLVIEPWVHPEQWRDGNLDASAAKTSDLAVARAIRSTRSGAVTTLDMYWALVSNSGIETFNERHTAGLYTHHEYEQAMSDAGLTVEHEAFGLIGRGLFIGIKTANAASSTHA